MLNDCAQIGFTEAEGREYADAVATYLAFAVSRAADFGCTLASWRAKDNAMRSAFSKQAMPMVWDYAEGNPFESSSAGFLDCVEVVAKCLHFVPAGGDGAAKQLDATQSVNGVKHPII